MKNTTRFLVMLSFVLFYFGHVFAIKPYIVVPALDGVYCLDDAGNLVWSRSSPTCSSPAIADIDNDGLAEVIIEAPTGDSLLCLTLQNGQLEWSFPFTGGASWGTAIANIDTIGTPEILIPGLGNLYCLNYDGSVKWTAPIPNFGVVFYVTVANVDTTDGTPEVLVGGPKEVYCLNSSGNFKWSYQMQGLMSGGIGIADLNLDGAPEIVMSAHNIADSFYIYCLKGDGSEKWVYRETPTYLMHSVSQPAIADINQDNIPEIVVAMSPQIMAFQENAAGTGLDTVWITDGCNDLTVFSSAGPVICDIDGDQDKDVLWVGNNGPTDMYPLYILNGMDGRHPDNSSTPCYEDSNFCSRTAFEHGIAIADIDEDGHLEIVGISANGGDVHGVAVIECDSTWAGARNLFSSHLYHTTEINDDITVPLVEPNNWETHNTWLTQLTTGGSGFGTPTLKWFHDEPGFGWIVASIAIAPPTAPTGTEEEPIYFGAKVLYKNGNQVLLLTIPKEENVSFSVFDVTGRARKVVNVGTMGQGMHEIPLSLDYVKNGIYFIRVRIGEKIFTCKSIVIK